MPIITIPIPNSNDSTLSRRTPESGQRTKTHRVPGADFDDVTYADDTICISRCIQTMNEFIENIDIEGFKYGMRLSKN